MSHRWDAVGQSLQRLQTQKSPRRRKGANPPRATETTMNGPSEHLGQIRTAHIPAGPGLAPERQRVGFLGQAEHSATRLAQLTHRLISASCTIFLPHRLPWSRPIPGAASGSMRRSRQVQCRVQSTPSSAPLPAGRLASPAAACAAYSITSSARSSIDGGVARPSAVAVLRFTIISNVVGS